MVDFIEKGGLYDHAEDETIRTWGVAARAQDWDQALIAARELRPKKDQSLYKLQIRKDPAVSDWPWFVKWVPRDTIDVEVWNPRVDAP